MRHIFKLVSIVGLLFVLDDSALAVCKYGYPHCVKCDTQNLAQAINSGCFPCGGNCAGLQVAGDTSFLLTSNETLATDVQGIKISDSALSQFASINPAVATTLLIFLDGKSEPTANLLRGAMAFTGVPTLTTFELTQQTPIAESHEEATRTRISRTLAPLPPNRYLQVRWDAVETDADTLQVTFFSEVIDDKLRAYKRTNANAVLLVSKSTRAVLSLAEQ